MAIPFLTNIDLNKNELQNAVVQNLGTAPSSPSEGQIYFDSTGGDKKMYYHNGSAWVSMSGDIDAVTVNAGEGLEVEAGSASTTSGAFSVTLGLQSAVAGSGLSYSSGVLSVDTLNQDTTGNAATVTTNANLTGDVTSSGNATTIAADAVHASMINDDLISASASALTSGLASTDEFLISDAGTLKNMDVSVLQSYLQSNLTFTTNTNTNQLTTFVVEDGDGTEVTISQGKQWKFVEGTGIDINWTDTDSGADGDEYDLTLTVDLEGTEVKSTGESGGTKFLREDGDGTCSWQSVSTTDVDVNVANLTARLPQITENVTIGDATDVTVTTAGDLVVTGDLTISGDTVTANVATLDVEDKNITVNKSSGDSSSTANGAGLTIQDAVDASTDATMLWDATNDEFDFSHAINVTGNISVSGTVDGIDIATDVAANTAKVTNVTTNLGITGTNVARTITSSDGTDAVIPVATTSVSGVMSAAQVTALNANTAKNTNVSTDLGVTTSSTTLVVTSSDGTNATLPVATTSAGGVMSAALFDSLAAAQTSGNVTTAITNNHNAKNKSWVLNATTDGVASTDNITYTITHGLGASRLYKVEVIESSGNGQTVFVDTKRPSDTTIVVVFGAAVTAGDYTALVTKID